MSFLKPTPATSNSTSGNVNNSLIQSDFAPTIAAGSAATSDLSSALTGPNGYANYLQNAGYAPAMKQLSQGVVGQGAAAGLLNSGSTAQALQTKGTALNSQFYNNYLQNLSGIAGQGLQAGGLVAGTGQQSTGTSNGGGPSTAGTIAGVAGTALSLFSDRRLKDDIRLIRRDADGLGWYDFRYKHQNRTHRGVMADEVAQLRPHALGPRIDGYATVNYGAL